MGAIKPTADTGKNRAVDLYVQAQRLFSIGERATEAQIDSLTAFASNQVLGGAKGWKESEWQSHRDYELDVYKNHSMTWIVPASFQNIADTTYHIRLVSVNHVKTDGSPNIFNAEVLNVAANGTITAEISNAAVVSSRDYTYTLKFTISHNGVTKTFTIDPKLRIRN